jgi:hypothetical protein
MCCDSNLRVYSSFSDGRGGWLLLGEEPGGEAMMPANRDKAIGEIALRELGLDIFSSSTGSDMKDSIREALRQAYEAGDRAGRLYEIGLQQRG